MPKTQPRRKDLIYPDLCYTIGGVLFDVGNELSFGHREHFYQKAVAERLKGIGLKFDEQLPAKVYFQGKYIGIYYFDFLIDNKIILEIKVAEDFYQKDVNQLLSYLKHNQYRLGILAIFTKKGLKFKRILN